MQRYVVFYESADDVMSKAPAVYPRHLARLKEFATRTFAGWNVRRPAGRGFDGGFRVPEAAEEFVSDDPFVSEGVVKAWTLRVGRGRERDLSGFRFRLRSRMPACLSKPLSRARPRLRYGPRCQVKLT